MASAADPSTPLPPEELSGDESSASFAPSVDSDDGNWEDWLDDEPPTRCLFCADIAASPAACVLHMAETHAFDLPGAARRLGDDLAVVRLVNWIRASGIAPEQANTPPQDIVSNEQYLKPVLDDDPLLYCEFLLGWATPVFGHKSDLISRGRLLPWPVAFMPRRDS